MAKEVNIFNVLAATTVLLIAVGSIGCKSGNSRADADAATIEGGIGVEGGGTGSDVRPDSPDADARTCEAGSGKLNGQSCACAGDCASGFCVDGVCCNTACTEGCMTCAAEESAGTCVGIQPGGKPRTASACVAAAVTTCGLDGTCDGAGACRKYAAGTMCKPGTCDGDAVVGMDSCDGMGRCKPGATVICVPLLL